MRTFKINLSEKRFNKITAKSFAFEKNRHYFWNCLCDCGKEVIIDGDKLRQGRVYSCGCSRYARIGELKTTHGHAKKGRESPEYGVWKAMRQRCSDEKNKSYHRYGGRGIKVCDRWENSFEAFFEDMGKRPHRTQIDRINNNGNYEPGNCRWVERSINHMNRRVTYIVEVNGEKTTLLDLSKKLGIQYDTLFQRLEKLGWTLEKAINTPVRKRNI